MDNLKINAGHHVVIQGAGAFAAGAVLPSSAVDGGRNEVDRLRRLGAVVLTDEEPTVFVPASASAVAEMPDDELSRENRRLKAEMESRDQAHRELAAQVARMETQLAESRKPADLSPAGGPANKPAAPAADPSAPPASLGPPVPGSNAEAVAKAGGPNGLAGPVTVAPAKEPGVVPDTGKKGK